LIGIPSLLLVNKKGRICNKSKNCSEYTHYQDSFCAGNRKAGNNDGDQILSLFRRLLNPAQITDLAERDPVAALEWCRLLGKTPSTILVAGGDGTIAWLLNTINKLQLQVHINSFF